MNWSYAWVARTYSDDIICRVVFLLGRRRWRDTTTLRVSLSVSCGQLCRGCLRENFRNKKPNRLAYIRAQTYCTGMYYVCAYRCRENIGSSTVNPTNPELIATILAAEDAPIHVIYPPLTESKTFRIRRTCS